MKDKIEIDSDSFGLKETFFELGGLILIGSGTDSGMIRNSSD